MKNGTLGAQLARRRADEGTQAFADSAAQDRVPTSQESKRIQALFGSAQSRLRRLVRLAVTVPEVQLVDAHDELGMLQRSCAPVRWTLAIEAPAHPFHEQWQAFRQWALEEELVVQLVERPHPVLTHSVYFVQAIPAA